MALMDSKDSEKLIKKNALVAFSKSLSSLSEKMPVENNTGRRRVQGTNLFICCGVDRIGNVGDFMIYIQEGGRVTELAYVEVDDIKKDGRSKWNDAQKKASVKLTELIKQYK